MPAKRTSPGLDRSVAGSAQGTIAEMDSLRVKKIPGRRDGDDVLRDIDILQNTVNALRGCGLIPKGVYRFQTHQEADEWMMRQIAANHARHRSKN